MVEVSPTVDNQAEKMLRLDHLISASPLEVEMQESVSNPMVKMAFIMMMVMILMARVVVDSHIQTTKSR